MYPPSEPVFASFSNLLRRCLLSASDAKIQSGSFHCQMYFKSGVRQRLTRWQARFWRCYEQGLASKKNLGVDPRDIQKTFPLYVELAEGLRAVNDRLIKYRKKLHDLISGA